MKPVRLVVMTAPEKLTPSLREAVLQRLDFNLEKALTLSAGEAWQAEIPALAGQQQDALKEANRDLRARLEGLPVDAALVARDAKNTKLLAADMDSTMIGQECIDEMAERGGVGDAVKAVTESAMRGEIDFTASLHKRVGTLAGLSADIIDELLAEVITITPGAVVAIRTLAQAGIPGLLVSGGFTAFALPLSALIGFRWAKANQLEISHHQITGKVIGDLVDGARKVHELERHAKEIDARPEEALAVGDGANDLPMLRKAGLGVAFRAKPKVRAEADATLDHMDLRGLLFLLGFSAKEFMLTDHQALKAVKKEK